VLPPDARHVSYEVIPLPVAEGCLYDCAFCRVKDRKPFAAHEPRAIDERIERLRDFFGPDLVNRNAVMLAGNDALAVPASTLLHAARQARRRLVADPYMRGRLLFLFASADSLLAAEPATLAALEETGFTTFINVGLESADQATLDRIGKPLTTATVRAAFGRMLEINERHPGICVTANFLWDGGLPAGHLPALHELVRDLVPAPTDKGGLYLSPLRPAPAGSRLLFALGQLKAACPLPLHLYLIQRL
jgi:hypothetical protein